MAEMTANATPVDVVKEVQSWLKTGPFVNEASVTQGAVLPILRALGWPIFDAQIVCPEYTVERSRVDFALCQQPRRPKVFIEVKQVEKIEGADRQLFEYAFHVGVPMAILTTGQEWHFYLPAEQGTYQDRRVYRLDLLEQAAEECASRLNRYLSFRRVETGESLMAAREDYRGLARTREIPKTLPYAWRRLIEEKDEILIERIATKVEEICGYKPNPDTVAGFLKAQVPPDFRVLEARTPALRARRARKTALTQRSDANIALTLRSDAMVNLVLERLVGEQWLTDLCRDVGERLGVSERTIRRVVEKLVGQGVVAQTRYGGKLKVSLTRLGLVRRMGPTG
jgi:hypothetical protein